MSVADQCRAKAWPMALPDLRGKRFEDAGLGDGVCFNIKQATAPDGHNVLFDSDSSVWVVTGQSPAPGTLVSEKEPIAVTVGPGQPG
ncbi:PASTA domain-containing protein [Nocardia sp. NPDC051030]|uniref:PASTA domain-containing protein n=1 Tax=Nocardia sp. NPDC051030 TaxID=3155162 RepID=UPI00341AFE36